MRNTMFGTQIRMLFCENCGAPLETVIEGGAVACSYCKATNAVRPRLDRFEAKRSSELPEPERIARLRMQDGVPYTPPARVAQLAVGDMIPDHKLTEAFDVFQATRLELKQTNGLDPSERMYALAVLVANTLLPKGDAVRARTALETALDVVVLERQRSCLRATLARHATREGDLLSAEQWLAGCDPRSDDLPSDSDYRVAQAVIDTARGNYHAVLATLGADNQAIPIADALDGAASVLRANALERLGDLPRATNLLVDQMGRAGAFGRRAIDSFALSYASLSLCPQSLPQATAAYAKKAAAKEGGFPLGLVIVGIFLLPQVLGFIGGPLVIALFLFLGGAASGDPTVFISSALGSLPFCLIPLLILSAFGLVGYFIHRAGKKRRWLREHGIPVFAQVRSFGPTGVFINNRPQQRLQLAWQSQAGLEEASINLTEIPTGQLLAPGAMVPIRVHPENSKEFVLELD